MTDFSVNKILKVLHIVALYSKYTRALTSDFFFLRPPRKHKSRFISREPVSFYFLPDTQRICRLLRVYVLRKDGKVGARTVGPPAWPKLVQQIRMLPPQDEYGTP